MSDYSSSNFFFVTDLGCRGRSLSIDTQTSSPAPHRSVLKPAERQYLSNMSWVYPLASSQLKVLETPHIGGVPGGISNSCLLYPRCPQLVDISESRNADRRVTEQLCFYIQLSSPQQISTAATLSSIHPHKNIKTQELTKYKKENHLNVDLKKKTKNGTKEQNNLMQMSSC